jgi:hypothetical protein
VLRVEPKGLRAVEDGVQLSRRNAPELFAALDELGAQLRHPPIRLVTITHDYNIFLENLPQPWWLPVSPLSRLVIGDALLTSLDVAEMRAVLAHEMAHFAHRDGMVRRRSLRLRKLWYRDPTVSIAFSGWRLVWNEVCRLMSSAFDAAIRDALYALEFGADEIAAKLVGADVFSRTLIRSEVRVLAFETLSPLSSRFSCRDYEDYLERVCVPLPVKKCSQFLHTALVSDNSKTHPSIGERFENLGYSGFQDTTRMAQIAAYSPDESAFDVWIPDQTFADLAGSYRARKDLNRGGSALAKARAKYLERESKGRTISALGMIELAYAWARADSKEQTQFGKPRSKYVKPVPIFLRDSKRAQRLIDKALQLYPEDLYVQLTHLVALACNDPRCVLPLAERIYEKGPTEGDSAVFSYQALGLLLASAGERRAAQLWLRRAASIKRREVCRLMIASFIEQGYAPLENVQYLHLLRQSIQPRLSISNLFVAKHQSDGSGPPAVSVFLVLPSFANLMEHFPEVIAELDACHKATIAARETFPDSVASIDHRLVLMGSRAGKNLVATPECLVAVPIEEV